MMLNFKKNLIIFVYMFVFDASAMTCITKKLSTLINSARDLSMPVRHRSTFSSFSNQVVPQVYNQAFKEQLNSRWGKSVFKGIVGLGIMYDVKAIADRVQGSFNMTMFDETLIPDELSHAIVVIDSEKIEGSAFIVRSEENPELYLVLTAAHCVVDEEKKLQRGLRIKMPRSWSSRYFSPARSIIMDVEPIIVDSDKDIAVLRINPDDVLRVLEDLKHYNSEIPFIPLKQLALDRPYKNEAAVVQGYPYFLSQYEAFYRKKAAALGQRTRRIHALLGSKSNVENSEYFVFNESRHISGASGGPVIALRNKQPQVIGIVHGGCPNRFISRGTMQVAGSGELSDYFRKAESQIVLKNK